MLFSSLGKEQMREFSCECIRGNAFPLSTYFCYCCRLITACCAETRTWFSVNLSRSGWVQLIWEIRRIWISKSINSIDILSTNSDQVHSLSPHSCSATGVVRNHDFPHYQYICASIEWKHTDAWVEFSQFSTQRSPIPNRSWCVGAPLWFSGFEIQSFSYFPSVLVAQIWGYGSTHIFQWMKLGRWVREKDTDCTTIRISVIEIAILVFI